MARETQKEDFRVLDLIETLVIKRNHSLHYYIDSV